MAALSLSTSQSSSPVLPGMERFLPGDQGSSTQQLPKEGGFLCPASSASPEDVGKLRTHKSIQETALSCFPNPPDSSLGELSGPGDLSQVYLFRECVIERFEFLRRLVL